METTLRRCSAWLLVLMLGVSTGWAQADLTGNWTGGFGGKATIAKNGDQGAWRIDADWGHDNLYVIEVIQQGDKLVGSWHGSAGITRDDPKGLKRHKYEATVSADGNTITPTSKCEDAGKSHFAWGTLKRQGTK